MDTQNTVRAQRQQEASHISAQLKHALPSILAGYPIDIAYVYGSVARGALTPLSDVDIALVLEARLPPYDQLKLELAVQGAIEDTLDLPPVDVRVINSAPLTVRGRILQHGILLYERDRTRRVAYEVETRKRYFDFAPVDRRLRDTFLQRVHREGLLYG